MNDKTLIKEHDTSWDIFRSGSGTYIVRNDLQEGNSFCLKFLGAGGEKSDKPEVFDMAEPISGGEHYLGHSEPWHYCIKGDQYFRVTNVEKGTGLKIQDLNKGYIGGKHYFQRDKYFYCIKHNPETNSNDILLRAGSLAYKPEEFTLSPSIVALNPICIWANGNFTYVLSQADANKTLLVYRTDGSLDSKKLSFKEYTVQNSVKKFMPGGLANAEGKSRKLWNNTGEGWDNRGNSEPKPYTFTWSTEVGQSKEKIKTIENNWNVKLTQTLSTEITVGVLVAKAELSLETQYGGSELKTNIEAWQSKKNLGGKLETIVPAGARAIVWEPEAAIGQLGSVLKGQYAITNTGEPPKIMF